MLSWLRHQRETAEKIESEAKGVINNLGAGACSAARLREHEASSPSPRGTFAATQRQSAVIPIASFRA
jgi:hypothetical protein